MHIDSVEGFFLVQAKASGPEENPVLLSWCTTVNRRWAVSKPTDFWGNSSSLLPNLRANRTFIL